MSQISPLYYALKQSYKAKCMTRYISLPRPGKSQFYCVIDDFPDVHNISFILLVLNHNASFNFPLIFNFFFAVLIIKIHDSDWFLIN